MTNKETFLEYIQIGQLGRIPIIKTRIRLTSSQILRLEAFKEEEQQVGPKFKNISNTALKMRINYRNRKSVKK